MHANKCNTIPYKLQSVKWYKTKNPPFKLHSAEEEGSAHKFSLVKQHFCLLLSSSPILIVE